MYRFDAMKARRVLAVVGCAAVVLGAGAAAAEAQPAAADTSWSEALASSLEGSIASGHLWIALLAAWVGGLLTSLTPCVWPLIPITVGYFGAMQDSDRGQVFRRALVYVAGMMMLYSTLGVAFASLGKLHGSLLSSPWISGAIAALCVAMGLSMLGLFTIQLPASWATKLSQAGGAGTGGALIMGLVSGLIAAPCTGPVLAVVLALVATTGEIGLGLVLMIAFSMGLGTPFLVIAVLSGRRVPTGGLWMDVVKTILATAMFSVAVYFLQIASPEVREVLRAMPVGTMGGVVLVVTGLVAGALLFSLHGRPAGKVVQVITMVLLTAGISLAVLGSPVTHAEPGVLKIRWDSEHDPGLARARSEKRPVIIDFTAEWCAACKELEHKTYVDEKVRAEAARFVTLKLDATEMTDAMEALFDKYGVLGLPTVVFIDSEGEVLAEPRVTGYVPAEKFLELMRRVH
jgi:thiol:disulfide interchange protein DsbD